MKTINKLENGRAAFAYKCVEDAMINVNKKEYKSYVKKIPMLIKTNGLGATVAFMKAKRGTYDYIYKQLSEWFKNDKNPLKFDMKELVKDVCEMDSQQYRAVTSETLSFFTWLRRFAEGMVEEDRE